MSLNKEFLKPMKTESFRCTKNWKRFLARYWVLICFGIILLTGFFIRIHFYTGTYEQPLWWDEADYMSYSKRIGKNLEINDIWYYRRTYFMPLVWGGLFGLGFDEPFIRFTEILFGLGTIIFTFLAGKEMFNEKVGLIAAAGMAFSRLPLFLGTRFMTNLPATCFFLIGLWLFWRGYVNNKGYKLIWLSAIFVGAAIFSRMSLLLCLVPFGAYVLFHEKGRFWKNKHLWIFAGILFLIMLPYLIRYAQHMGEGIFGFFQHYTGFGRSYMHLLGVKGIIPYIGSLYLNIGLIYSILTVIGFSLFFNLIAIDKIFSNKKVQKTVFVLLWILIPFLFHSMYSEYLQERLIFWTYPAFFMLAGFGAVKSYGYAKKYGKYAPHLFICLLVIFIVFTSYQQIGLAKGLIENKKTSYWQIKYASLWMKENSDLEDVIISNSIPQTQYYSERSVYMPANASHLESYNPKYIVTSVFEKSEDWFYKYPEEKGLKPVKAYFADSSQQQIILVVFEYRG